MATDESVSDGPNDPAAVAEALVTHAEAICADADHLWTVLRDLSIPTALLPNHRQQHKVTYSTEAMAKAYLYKQIRGYKQKQVAEHLSNRLALREAFGFDQSPDQQIVSYAWRRFETDDASIDSKDILNTAARGIAQTAADHDIIHEAYVPDAPGDDEVEDDDGEPTAERKYVRRRGGKLVDVVRKHGFPEFHSGRADNRIYEDDEVLQLFTNAALTRGSAHSEGEAGWFLDENDICDDSTFLRIIKQFATPIDDDGDVSTVTLDRFDGQDAMPFIDRYRDALMDSFDAAIDNVLTTIRHEREPFDSRHTVAAIDTTTIQFHVYPWEDKANGIAKPNYPPMVSGYTDKDTGGIEYAYTFATITLVGDDMPIVLGIEPVKENSGWEPDDAPSYSKDDVVARLLDKAQARADIDEVLLDRGFYAKGVYAAIHDRDLLYTGPVPKYEDDYAAIDKIESKDGVDAGVKHDCVFGIDGEVHHEAELLYVPTTDEDADGNYAVFVTNRDRVEPDEIVHVTNSYSRRWDIENQYKSIKDFKPKTSSKDYRVRLFNFTFAALLYSLWRLLDYLVKVGMGRDLRTPPVVTAKTFVRALGGYLREVD